MKNSLRRIFALLMAVMMIASLGMSAFAEGETVIDKVTFTKTVTKEENVYTPNTSYTFTIAEGSADTTKGVFAGVANGALFVDGDDAGESQTVTADGKTLTITAAADLEVVSYNGNIALDVSKFDETGIYRYVVTETVEDDDKYAGITYDNVTRYLDVYVAEDDTGNKKISGAILYKSNAEADEDGNYNAADKGGFTNVYTTANLTVSKAVDGNMADTNKVFLFDLQIFGEPGKTYNIKKADASFEAIIADATGLASLSGIALKANESFVVYGLAADENYTVTEHSYANEGYETSYTVKLGDGEPGAKETQNTANGTISETTDDVTVAYTNYKDANVPTGIAMTVLPFVAMIALAAIVAVLFFQKRERREA